MGRYRLWLIALLAGLAVAACGCTAASPAQPALPDAGAASAVTTSAGIPPPHAGTANKEDATTVGKDPATDRNAQIDFSWEQYCYSSDYQLQIAKDPDFSIIVLDTGSYSPAPADYPAAYFPSGGMAPSRSSLTGWAHLEAGKTYYWRVRAVRSATGQHLRSPWSEVKSFTVEP